MSTYPRELEEDFDQDELFFPLLDQKGSIVVECEACHKRGEILTGHQAPVGWYRAEVSSQDLNTHEVAPDEALVVFACSRECTLKFWGEPVGYPQNVVEGDLKPGDVYESPSGNQYLVIDDTREVYLGNRDLSRIDTLPLLKRRLDSPVKHQLLGHLHLRSSKWP